jgi:hypothetical protein
MVLLGVLLAVELQALVAMLYLLRMTKQLQQAIH